MDHLSDGARNPTLDSRSLVHIVADAATSVLAIAALAGGWLLVSSRMHVRLRWSLTTRP